MASCEPERSANAVPDGLLRGASLSAFGREALRGLPGGGFFVYDTELRLRFVEGAVVRATGVDPSELEGKLMHEFVAEPIAEIIGPMFQRALAGETESIDLVSPLSGQVHWVQASPVHDDDGTVVGITAISLDLTDKLQVAEALTRSEQRHRSIVEALEEGILLVSADGSIVSCNPSAERILGRSADAILGVSVADSCWRALTEEGAVCPPAELPISVTLRTGQPQLGVVVGMERPDGETRWLSVNAVALPDGGDREGAVCSFLDVTEARTAFARLRKRDDTVTTAMNNAPIGIALVSLDGRYEAVNPAMCKLLGRTAAELRELTYRDVTHPERTETDAAAERQLSDGLIENVQATKRYVRPDGSTVSALVSVTVMRDSDGRPVRFVTQAVDISDRLHAEEELEQRVLQQSVVARVGEHALEGVEMTRLLDDAVAAIAVTLGVDLVSILELCNDGESVRLAAGAGFPDGMVRGLTMPVSEGHRQGLAQLLEGPIAIDDITASDLPSNVLARYGVVSTMSVLIGERGQPFGALGVHSRRHRRFTSEDASFVQSVANVLWNAIARRRSEERIRHQALHDPLTGLPNRALFLDRLTQALARSRRHHTQLAVVLLDLDHFKFVNDSLGHHAGDELLRALTPRLAQAVRVEDTVARLGGDEFVVLCEDVDEREVGKLAGRISETLTRPFLLDGSEHFVRASVGAVLADARATPEGLLRDADAAMYRAKERGRGRYELFDETMRSRAIVRLQTETDLRRALERGELEVFYQPYFTLSDRKLVGMEALVRWRHPERGLLLPGDFVPIAEETGLIVEVGEYVLRAASDQLAAWRRRLADPGELGVSVNVSARQLMQPGLVDVVAAALHASGLEQDAHLLGLEITESALVVNGEQPEAILAELKRLGVNLVLDDFGTGYSSLSHLKRFPFDVLKIDRAFIDGLGKDDGEDEAIVTATMGMGSAMRLHVVAEGVETGEQIERLRALGCEVAQGFVFSQPLPAELMGELIMRELGSTAPVVAPA